MTDPTQQPDPAVTSLTAKAGDKVDNYTIMEQIGAGGTAIVFRGHDHVLNRDVAIKQLVVPPGDAGDETRQRAMAEAQLHKQAAASDPKLLVQYIDTINDPRGLFLISEYVDGPSLEWILQQETSPMEQRQALGIIAATAKALHALHATGMVHRDLKPANILMPREGGLKLADFGLAAIIADQQSMDLGSVRYMAPEILQGQVASAKSDLYALGIIAYEMLAGRENFNEAFRTILRDQRNQSMRWVKWHTNARARVASLDQLVDGIPESLAQLVARMMEKDPARRVGSARELIEAIRTHFASGGQDTQSPSPHAAMAPPKIEDVSQTAAVPQRNKLLVVLGVTLAVWVLAIGGFFFWKHQEEVKAREQEREQLIGDIEAADRLITDQQYSEARSAFMRIPADYPGQFDPDNRRYRDDLIDAGRLKAEGLLAAKQGDFITARDKYQQYEKLMTPWSSQSGPPRTSLSLNDAKKTVEEYEKRASFQELADQIAAMLEAGELDRAIQTIRLVRSNSADETAREDLARLDDLEDLYEQLLADRAVQVILTEARDLRDKGELADAIALLDEQAELAGDSVDLRVQTLLDELVRQARIKELEAAIAQTDDRRQKLAALIELQKLQRTEARAMVVRDLTITTEIELAETALAGDLPETAEQHLAKVEELDPDNAQAKRIRERIANARLMSEAVARGDRHLADGAFEEATKQYRLALSYGADTTGRINAKLQEAAGRLYLARADAALEAEDVTAAQSHVDAAEQALGDTDAVQATQARVDDLRDYTTLVAEGDALFDKEDFGRAKVKYLAAKEIFSSEAINQKVRDCDFGNWLKQCDQAILTRDWEAAEGALNRAEEIKQNDQTRARREKIDNRVQ